ncbi:MAG TPA: diguanylate cyclase [Planctomycetota bacterium]|nr:diguanylate cyclase [Planctomycetota bacterium]
MLIGLGFMLLFTALDMLTPTELHLSIFYVLPVLLMSWCGPRWMGLVSALMAAICWHVADAYLPNSQHYFMLWVPYWNGAVLFSFFAIISTLLSGLRSSLHREQEVSRTDFLTGVANSRHFSEMLNYEIIRSQRHQYPFTVVYLDLDNFKAVNDEHGHSVGDELLRRVGQTLRQGVRGEDIVARLGGDEFAILLIQANFQTSAMILERLHKELMEAMKERNWPVTFSIGASTFAAPPLSVNQAIQLSDKLMYQVKSHGKNALRHEVIGNSTLVAAIKAEW